VSSNYVKFNKKYEFKTEISCLLVLYISCVQTSKQLAQTYQIRQTFPELAYKINVFLQTKNTLKMQ